MTWSPSSLRRAPEVLSAHLEGFTEQIGELAVELRASVAGLTGDAIGRAVRDVLMRFWSPSSRTNPHPSRDQDDPYGWPNEQWDRPPSPWEESERASGRSVPPPAAAPRLALLLQIGGWLLQHGSVWGLVGVGAAVGGVILFPGSIGVNGIDLFNAVAELAALIALLSSASKQVAFN